MKRPALYAALSISAGILFAKTIPLSIVYPAIIGALAIVSAFVFSKKNAIAHLCLYLALASLGAAYFTYHSAIPRDSIFFYASEEPAKAFLRGIVRDDPVMEAGFYAHSKRSFIMDVKAVSGGDVWRRACGYAKVISYWDKSDINYGDEIIAEGKLSRPVGLKNPGTFDYSRYMALKGIYAILKVGSQGAIKAIQPASRFSVQGIAYRMRHWARYQIESSFDKKHAGFLKSIILGDRADLGEGLKEDFIRTGTVHVLAVSGLNVAFIAAISLGILGLLRVPRTAGLFVTTVVLVFYTFITGANPPIIRAVIMFTVFVLGYILQRDSDPVNTLSIAAIAILAMNPNELFDPSFQLSFASVAGVVIFMPWAMKAFGLDHGRRGSFLQKVRFYLLSGIAVSTAAWVGSAPLTAAYFNIVTPVSLAANLIIVPALSVLTALSFAFLAVTRISADIGHIFAYLIKAFDNTVFFANHIMASMPLAYFRVPAPPVYLCILFYITTAFLLVRNKKYFILSALILCNAVVWSYVLQPKGELEITFLDVGQGDSAHIRTPSGENILIDGASGGEEERFDLGRSVIAPYLWNKGIFRIDLLVVTHFHEDHIGGVVYLLNNFDIGCVVDGGGQAQDSGIYRKYINAIRQRKIKRIVVRGGNKIGPVGDIVFYVLNPPADKDVTGSNDDSVVVKLQYKNFGALFCGDIAQEAIRSVAGYGDMIKSDVIKVPHHGGNLGDIKDVEYFLDRVGARVAVISVGRNNRYRFPSKNTVETILSSGAAVYETKESGAIIISVPKTGAVKVEKFFIKN